MRYVGFVAFSRILPTPSLLSISPNTRRLHTSTPTIFQDSSIGTSLQYIEQLKKRSFREHPSTSLCAQGRPSARSSKIHEIDVLGSGGGFEVVRHPPRQAKALRLPQHPLDRHVAPGEGQQKRRRATLPPMLGLRRQGLLLLLLLASVPLLCWCLCCCSGDMVVVAVTALVAGLAGGWGMPRFSISFVFFCLSET